MTKKEPFTTLCKLIVYKSWVSNLYQQNAQHVHFDAQKAAISKNVKFMEQNYIKNKIFVSFINRKRKIITHSLYIFTPFLALESVVYNQNYSGL